MMRTLATLTILLGVVNTQAQRTPGRVGGSTNPPAEARVHKQVDPGDVSLLSGAEKQEFEQVKKQIPKLAVRDFLVLKAATKSLREEHGRFNAVVANPTDQEGTRQDINVITLATHVAAHKNDLASALQSLGVSQKQAELIRNQAKNQADAQIVAERKK